ncbi:phospholipase A2 inhibitor NAI-like [Aquarana catesbeiana]|uniref:phospholipase A2 inhibitor NAI-like n=1 Tax=Aquarana catesbeiana TaxID=8400 RepID=UPI003CCA4101
MSPLVHILGVFLALVASGYSLSCTHCVSSSDSCTGTSMPCPSGSVCGAQYTETWALGAPTSKEYMMSCIPQNKCNIKGSFTQPKNVRVKMGISCCTSDRCTPSLPSLPRDSSGSNGLTCRSCMSTDSTSCYTSDTIQCTGDENMCLLQTTKISGKAKGSKAIRGCATKSICDSGSLSSSSQGVKTDIKYICTSGSAGLQNGFYLPAMICIFFSKLLF